MWTVGEIFTDSVSGIQVSIDAAYETGYQVTIDYTVCSELPLARQFLGGRDGSASVRVRAPSSCSWAATSHSPWITIAKGSGKGGWKGQLHGHGQP